MRDSELIDALGGTAAVAKLCEVSRAAVSQWRTDGIPKSRRMYLKVVRPDVFARILVSAPAQVEPAA